MTRFGQNLGGWAAAATIMIFVGLAIAAPWIAPYDPFAQDLTRRLMSPSWTTAGDSAHLLGTDALGRDYFSRLLYGGRISLTVGLLVALVSGAIGTTLGLLGGYFGGRTDAIVMFIVTTRLSMPVVLVALAVVALVGASLWSTVLVLGLLFWDRFAVVVRGATRQFANKEFVVAARALGASHSYVLFRELLPNLRPQVMAVATIEMSHAILVESALSFLGVGIQPPTPSWGLMVSEGRELAMFLPYLVAVPGLAIFALVVSINFIGGRIEAETGRRA